jgi:excisionase family DNA binding protein
MPSKYLFLEEVAEEARVSLSTVRHWISTGKLRSVKPGRRRMVAREDLDALLRGAKPAGSACIGADAAPSAEDDHDPQR